MDIQDPLQRDLEGASPVGGDGASRMTSPNSTQTHATAWSAVVLTSSMLMAGLIPAGEALAQTPDYQGEVCRLDDQRVRFSLQTETAVTNVLIYPTPPGGGWYLDQTEPGRFEREFTIPSGQELTFTFLIQNPAQYSYPEHALRVDEGCVAFSRDQVMPPPIRGFNHELSEEQGGVRATFEASPGDGNIPPTGSVTLRYRLDGGDLQERSMDPIGGGVFTTVVPEAPPGAKIEYWFAQIIGAQPIDSTLFQRIVGEAPEEITFPIVSRTAGRFRDRHPNEWRFDHYVENYAGGKSFEIVVTDHGNSLDVLVVTQEVGGPERVDFKYYIQNNPQAMCDRPLTAINLVMDPVAGTNNRFESNIPDITPGQIIEFDFTHLGVPNPAGGTFQYYTEYFYYHAGTGRFGTAEANPRATAAGDASVPLVSAPRFAFAQHANNLSMEELDRFMAGKERFETDHLDGLLKNFPTQFDCCSGPIGYVLDPSPHARLEGLGPMFSAPSCIACHVMDGRGATPTGTESTLTSLVIQLAIDGTDSDGAPAPHPFYGRQFDTAARAGSQAEGRVTVAYEEIVGTFDDGSPYSLRQPVYSFRDTAYGSPGSNLPDAEGTPGYEGVVRYSPRIAPILAGTGLLEAVDASTILALADPEDRDGDGISGKANWVHDLVTGDTQLGRFGWKAGQPGLLQQTAVAYQRDLGLTSPWTPEHDCGPATGNCPDEAAPELAASDVSLVASYVEGLTLPARRNHENPEALIGMQLFKQANCQACHVPTLRTRPDHELLAFRDQVIEPFTDLLLHDMGPALADGFTEYAAGGNEWRTAPLWGAEYVGHVLGVPGECTDPYSADLAPNYLHDGRARSLMEAILWHGGEAESSRNAVLAMNQEERAALLTYVAYPFADPSLDPPVGTACPGDLDGDGTIGGGDLARLLTSWGTAGDGDLDGSGAVDGNDLTLLLADWGFCQEG